MLYEAHDTYLMKLLFTNMNHQSRYSTSAYSKSGPGWCSLNRVFHASYSPGGPQLADMQVNSGFTTNLLGKVNILGFSLFPLMHPHAGFAARQPECVSYFTEILVAKLNLVESHIASSFIVQPFPVLLPDKISQGPMYHLEMLLIAMVTPELLQEAQWSYSDFKSVNISPLGGWMALPASERK